MVKSELVKLILFFLMLLLSSSYVNANTYLFENSTWQNGLTAVQWASIALGDVDNDGDLDLALMGCNSAPAACDGYVSKIYTNDGISLTENSTWGQNLTALHYGSIAWGDIDNDGDLDLALTGCNNGGGNTAVCNGRNSFIYINNGTSLVENSTWKGDIINVWKGSIAFGDIDLDGKLDLALTGESSTAKIAKVYINNGTGFAEDSTWQQDLTGVFRSGIVFGDVDNDNDLDLILGGATASGGGNQFTNVYINNGSSLVSNSTWSANLLDVDQSSAAIGDVNNNGNLDLTLIGIGDYHRIYNNTGTSFTQIQKEPNDLIGIFQGSQAFGDYDNDGDLDLLATGEEKYTTLYLFSSSSGLFTIYPTDPEADIFNAAFGPSAAWGDLDNDNDLDLVLIGVDNADVTKKAKVYINNITTSNTAPSPPSSGFSSVFDDGKLTLSWGQGSDTETPAAGLYYNIRVGTCQGCNDTISGIYGGGDDNGYFGNMMQRRSSSITGLSASTDYNWSVQTIDTGLQAGGWSAEQTYTTAADITDPTITLNAPVDLFNTSNTTIIINATISDETDIGNVSLWSNYSGTWEVNQTNHSQANNVAYVFMNQSWSTEGTYLWGVEACDGTNNCVNSPNRTLTIDLTAPTILTANITPSNTSFTSDNTPFISFNATDGLGVNESSVTIEINNTVYNSTIISCTGTTGGKSCNFTLTAGLGDSNFSITFNITDFAGNRASSTTNFTVDTVPPSTNATLMAVNDTDLDGNIEISWQNDSSEAEATYWIYRHSSEITSSSIVNATFLYNTTDDVGNSFEDNTTTGDNATSYWYALVTVDRVGNVNTSAVSNSLNSTANDTIRPLPVINLTITGSSAIATLNWLAVERDVSGNADNNGMQYVVYYGTDFNDSKVLINDSISSASTKTVSTNTTTVSVGSTGTWHFAVSSLDDNGNENKSLNVSGNYGNVSLTVTADDPGNSGGSSGGGGGGGTAAATSAGVSSTKFYDILPSGSTIMNVVSDVIAVSELNINTRSESTSVEVKVVKLDEAPTARSNSRSVYQYLELTKSNLEDSDVDSVVIKFDVSKSWLTENKATETDVALSRFVDKWTELPTKIVSSNVDNIFYEATSPGFSYFAIVLKKAPEETPAVVEEAAEPEENVTESEPVEAVKEEKEEKQNLARIWLIIIGLFVISLWVIFAFKRKDKISAKRDKNDNKKRN